MLCIVAFFAFTIANLAACNSNENRLAPTYVDMPEEPPTEGDILQVLSVSGDTVSLGYLSPDSTRLTDEQ